MVSSSPHPGRAKQKGMEAIQKKQKEMTTVQDHARWFQWLISLIYLYPVMCLNSWLMKQISMKSFQIPGLKARLNLLGKGDSSEQLPFQSDNFLRFQAIRNIRTKKGSFRLSRRSLFFYRYPVRLVGWESAFFVRMSTLLPSSAKLLCSGWCEYYPRIGQGISGKRISQGTDG